MVSNTEIIKNDVFRYKFINQFTKGKILDHKSNCFTSYHSAKILLQNNGTDIYSLMNISDNEFSVRKMKNDGSIIFNDINRKTFKESFDSIISFQNLNQKNIFKKIEFYHNSLKKSGILILSVSNKRKNADGVQRIDEFTIDDLNEKIGSKFNITEIYSQRFIEKYVVNHSAVLSRRVKKSLANILKKMKIIRKIYLKNVKKTVSKYDPYKQYFHKIPDEDFVPKKYKKKDNSLFLILICKKK